MARAPKIPGLRSWTKVKAGPGHRTGWRYVVPGAGGADLHIFAQPNKASDGPITGYYGTTSGGAATPTVATKGEVIQHLKRWLKERFATRANPVVAAPRSMNPALVSYDAKGRQHRTRALGGSAKIEHRSGQPGSRVAMQVWDHGKKVSESEGTHAWADDRDPVPTGLARVRPNPGVPFDAIGPGDQVTIRVPAGRNRDGSYDSAERTGRVVMRGPAGWVLNLGGAHGTPGVATPENFVRARKGKGGKSPYWMRRSNPHFEHHEALTESGWHAEDAYPTPAAAESRAAEHTQQTGDATKIIDEGPGARLRYTIYVRPAGRRGNPGGGLSARKAGEFGPIRRHRGFAMQQLGPERIHLSATTGRGHIGFAKSFAEGRRKIDAELGSRKTRAPKRRNPARSSKWYVYLGDHHLDTVFYAPHVSADEVRRGLIDHDGYDPRIEVRQSFRERGMSKLPKGQMRRNPAAAICRHTLPLQKGAHGRVEVCYPQGVFPSLKAAVVNIQRELRAKYGRLKAAPALRRADWAYSDAGRTRGRWTFQG